MVLDERMPKDTLFLVFEEDFRFWPVGEDPDRADDFKARLEEVLKKGSGSASLRTDLPRSLSEERQSRSQESLPPLRLEPTTQKREKKRGKRRH